MDAQPFTTYIASVWGKPKYRWLEYSGSQGSGA